jgi:hypothetical protein
MAFGDTAKTALSEALKAYTAIVKLQGVVELMDRSIQQFQERQEREQKATEQRLGIRIDELTRRVRDLELEVSSLRGKVDGGFADALKVTILEPEIRRRMAKMGAESAESAVMSPSRIPPASTLGGPADHEHGS